MTKSNYPLLNPSPVKHEAIPFDLLKTEDFLPALEEAIAAAEKRLNEICDDPAEPTFENTMLALEGCGEDVGLVASTFYNLLSAHTNDEMQALATELSPRLTAYSNKILLNPKIFQRIKSLHDRKNELKLTAEQERLLETSYSDFVRNGAMLSEADKRKLEAIDEEMSQLNPKYSENVLKATNAYQLVIDSEADLAGLPDSARSAASEAAKEADLEGKWVITLHAPSFMPFMQYSEKRELREKLWKAFTSRSFNDEYDNQKNVLRIAKLRFERAQLLGFKTHADFVLQKRMAESPQTVMSFLDRLIDKSRAAAEKDVADIQAYAEKNGGPNPLMPWDFAFYSEKLKEEKYQYNDEELRPYFKLENVIEGVFEHARRLFQIEFKLSDEYPTYHEDVKVYEVYNSENSEFVGLFYADFFPRASKSGGAWMTSYLEQGLFKGKIRRPHVAIVCNFTKPLPDTPSLLTFGEVRTLFHEFGHSLHGLLSQCTYQSLAGTNVYWDFVELPSQIMENWVLEEESLALFAKHYQTGETIPKELIEKIKASSKYLAGYASMRQLNFGRLDMAWHHSDPTDIDDVDSFEKKATQDTQLLPTVPGSNSSCVFSHIFAGGYSAGYYSYKWAEVLDADAFEYFKEKGIFDIEVAKKFKTCVLERGGTDHPMTLYKNFRGREPDPDALLRRDGLI